MGKLVPAFTILLALGVASPSIASSSKSAVSAKTKVAYSVEQTALGTLLDDPTAKAIIQKYAPEVISHPQVAMARPLSLRQLQTFSGDLLNDAVLAKIQTALKAASPS